jgi:hypothetical protein
MPRLPCKRLWWIQDTRNSNAAKQLTELITVQPRLIPGSTQNTVVLAKKKNTVVLLAPTEARNIQEQEARVCDFAREELRYANEINNSRTVAATSPGGASKNGTGELHTTAERFKLTADSRTDQTKPNRRAGCECDCRCRTTEFNESE